LVIVLTISVIIPVFNGGAEFQRCLAAIGHSSVTPHELIVVDDGSTDNSRGWAAEAGARVLQTERQASGPAVARNIGAQAATGEILFFVDADVEIRPETLAHLSRILAEQPTLTALFGSYDDAPAAPNFLSQYKNLMHHYVHQHASAQASTFWSGCGAIRRETFLQFGGFSSRYAIPSIEDIELGAALTQAGHHIRLEKTLQVKHLKRWGWRSLLHSDIVARAIPWTRLILRMGKMPNDLNLQTSARVSVLLAYLLLGTIFIWPFVPIMGWVALACGLALLWLNRTVYVWFAQKRSGLFALGAVGMHWLYYFYSGLALGIGILWHVWDARAPK
jgi:glycosyltransferase involved in cell wall biosynthesis